MQNKKYAKKKQKKLKTVSPRQTTSGYLSKMIVVKQLQKIDSN